MYRILLQFEYKLLGFSAKGTVDGHGTAGLYEQQCGRRYIYYVRWNRVSQLTLFFIPCMCPGYSGPRSCPLLLCGPPVCTQPSRPAPEIASGGAVPQLIHTGTTLVMPVAFWCTRRQPAWAAQALVGMEAAPAAWGEGT